MIAKVAIYSGFTAAVLCFSSMNIRAEMFYLNGGEAFEGSIVRSIGNTISITLPGRGMRQLPIRNVDRIEFTLGSGERVAGKLVNWSGGAYEILVGDRLLSVSDGQIIENIDASRMEDRSPHSAAANADGSLRDKPRSEILPPVARNQMLPVLIGSATPTSEDAGDAIIQLNLSDEASKPIVIIYSALERSATAGADYEKGSGVLTIEPGAKNAAIHIPIINDEQAELDEEFELFLSIDPSMAHIDSRNIVITIQDDDS